MRKILMLCISLMPIMAFAYSKPVLGPTEFFSINQGQIKYDARIDTGASNSSLNAYQLHVIGGSSDNKADNIGKIIEFTTQNEKGQVQHLKARIVDISRVKNAQGKETRYMVELTLGFAGDVRKVRVNLRNREHMDFKLLIGRNWLKNHYLVDVQQKPIIGARAPIHIKEADLTFKARIDTGAVENSLHAYNLHVNNEDLIVKDNNIGKLITFTTNNEKGQTVTLTRPIVETSLIRNAQGSEVRYMVNLTLGEPGKEYLVRVNLKDRSAMKQKLLIGRNWLDGHYLVDVGR